MIADDLYQKKVARLGMVADVVAEFYACLEDRNKKQVALQRLIVAAKVVEALFEAATCDQAVAEEELIAAIKLAEAAIEEEGRDEK